MGANGKFAMLVNTRADAMMKCATFIAKNTLLFSCVLASLEDVIDHVFSMAELVQHVLRRNEPARVFTAMRQSICKMDMFMKRRDHADITRNDVVEIWFATNVLQNKHECRELAKGGWVVCKYKRDVSCSRH